MAKVLPVSMDGDEPMIRATLAATAQEQSLTVDEAAEIRIRVLTDRFDPEMVALMAEVDAV